MAARDGHSAIDTLGLRGCGTIALVAVALVLAAFALLLMLNPIGGTYPELHRPSAELVGGAFTRGGGEPLQVVAELSLDEGALEAAAAGDGLVHLEFDVLTLEGAERLDVGVRWADRAEVVEAGEIMTPDEDVRWSLNCAAVAPCHRTIAVTVEPLDVTGRVRLDWRLSAEVRPRRGADLPDETLITLVESEQDR